MSIFFPKVFEKSMLTSTDRMKYIYLKLVIQFNTGARRPVVAGAAGRRTENNVDRFNQRERRSCPFLSGIDRSQRATLPGVHFEVTRERAAEARFGISQMDWALADTGTLAQDATAVDKRLVSTLPAIHIALVATAALVPDMPTWLTKVEPSASGYLSLITGPSRTADIERVLTIGVHGPDRLIIVFCDESGRVN